MARIKKGKPENRLWTKAKWKAFVNIRLNSQEKKAIKEMSVSPEDLLQFFQDAATAGYKVSLSYSPSEDVMTLSLTGQYEQKPNAGLTCSLRHRDFETLIMAMLFVAGEDGYAIDWEERFGSASDDNW